MPVNIVQKVIQKIKDETVRSKWVNTAPDNILESIDAGARQGTAERILRLIELYYNEAEKERELQKEQNGNQNQTEIKQEPQPFGGQAASKKPTR